MTQMKWPLDPLVADCTTHPSTVSELVGSSTALLATVTMPFPAEPNESAYSAELATHVPDDPGLMHV
jgi:hypothetical protein